jgi:signal transduction histidine kinase
VRAERERDRLETELHQAQRLESIGPLAGGVAHDFNNLLSVILNYAGLAKEQVADAQVREDLTEIERAAGRAAALTRQLLTFGSRDVVRPANLDLNAILHDVASMLHGTAGDGVTVEMRLADGLWQVRADRGQLEQVLVNLAINAQDAMPSGGVLRIETWNVEGRGGRGPRVRLVVRDNGSGMSAAVREHAFEPFFTTKEPGEGTGLGLATVYGIVKSAGGDVTIESEPDHGTVVTVELPAVIGPLGDRERSEGASGAVAVESDEPARRN